MLRMDAYVLKIKTTGCLCCDSITCKNNWFVGCKLCDLFDEIHTNLTLKLRIPDLISCKHVVDQIFGHYIPIEEFL